MNAALTLIRESLAAAENAEVDFAPAVLMHRNINHDNVSEYACCYVNDSWTPKLKELMDNGFVVFRIQTELNCNGHSTRAYMAKMKSA